MFHGSIDANSCLSLQPYARTSIRKRTIIAVETFDVGNNIKAILTATGGDTHGVPVAELVTNIINTEYSENKLRDLFIYLKEEKALEMV